MNTVFVALILSLASQAAPTTPTVQGEPTANVEAQADNAELAAMFDADQAGRMSLMEKMNDPAADKAKLQAMMIEMMAEDERRLARVAEMLDNGEVRTGRDYYNASFLYQHGREAKHYLRAHTLAVTALAKGYGQASWISAAALDRYLQESGAPQIYGTQFTSTDEGMSQEPFDRELLSDAERVAVRVPPLAKQMDRYRDVTGED